MRVLLVGNDLSSTLVVARALRVARHNVWLAAAEHHGLARRSCAIAGIIGIADPNQDAAIFVSEVAAAAHRLKADAVLPANETALMLLAGRDGLFAPAYLGVPEPRLVETALAKPLVLDAARDAGFALPETRLVDATTAVAVDWPFPLVLKPARSKLRLADGHLRYVSACQVMSRAELQAAVEKIPEAQWMIQPFLRGTLAACCGLAWHGKVVSALHQRALRIWPPDIGYSSFAETVHPLCNRERKVRHFIASTHWTGIFQLQFLQTDAGEYFLDFNPRAYGSIALAIAAGHNLPAMWLTLVQGHTVATPPYVYGMRYRYEERDIRAIAASASLHGPTEWLALLPRRRTTHAVMSIHDIRPSATLLREAKAAAIRYCRLAPRCN